VITAASTPRSTTRSSASTAGNRIGIINSGARIGTGPRTRARSRNASEIGGRRPGRASGRRSYYDPMTGRYLELEPEMVDPNVLAAFASEGISLPAYAYAASNPNYYIDKDGNVTATAVPLAPLAIAGGWAFYCILNPYASICPGYWLRRLECERCDDPPPVTDSRRCKCTCLGTLGTTDPKWNPADPAHGDRNAGAAAESCGEVLDEIQCDCYREMAREARQVCDEKPREELACRE